MSYTIELPEDVKTELHRLLEDQASITGIDYTDPEDDYKRVLVGIIDAFRSAPIELSERQAELLLYELRHQSELHGFNWYGFDEPAYSRRERALDEGIEALEEVGAPELGADGENE